ncbi:hypothetical protein SDC9_125065 [bioreactor metagenome]|uniref:Uncharacterized protein n=1 Tax=bioreactor metagenome TaxID=1076179 RepID=A0A645CMC5_9ZZZZ
MQKRPRAGRQHRQRSKNADGVFQHSRSGQHRFRRLGDNASHHRHHSGNRRAGQLYRRGVRRAGDNVGDGEIQGKRRQRAAQNP